jgi:hypothetical protein
VLQISSGFDTDFLNKISFSGPWCHGSTAQPVLLPPPLRLAAKHFSFIHNDPVTREL